jgi:cytoskeletal protein RodZ
MEEEETTGQSRLFVILSIALIGLLVLGLLGIGGVFVIRQNMEEQALASRPSPTALIRLPEASPTSLPTRSVVATNTPAPTPTSTPVVAAGGGGEEAASSQNPVIGTGENAEGAGGDNQAAANTPAPNPSPTRTPAPSAETAGATEVPNTGLGALESVGLALGLIFVFFVARRLRLNTV